MVIEPFCHSERSEESAFWRRQRKADSSRHNPALGMTKNSNPALGMTKNSNPGAWNDKELQPRRSV